jgi:hypothetical protein
MYLALLLSGVYLGGALVAGIEHWFRAGKISPAEGMNILVWPLGVVTLLGMGREKALAELRATHPSPNIVPPESDLRLALEAEVSQSAYLHTVVKGYEVILTHFQEQVIRLREALEVAAPGVLREIDAETSVEFVSLDPPPAAPPPSVPPSTGATAS